MKEPMFPTTRTDVLLTQIAETLERIATALEEINEYGVTTHVES